MSQQQLQQQIQNANNNIMNINLQQQLNQNAATRSYMALSQLGPQLQYPVMQQHRPILQPNIRNNPMQFSLYQYPDLVGQPNSTNVSSINLSEQASTVEMSSKELLYKQQKDQPEAISRIEHMGNSIQDAEFILPNNIMSSSKTLTDELSVKEFMLPNSFACSSKTLTDEISAKDVKAELSRSPSGEEIYDPALPSSVPSASQYPDISSNFLGSSDFNHSVHFHSDGDFNFGLNPSDSMQNDDTIQSFEGDLSDVLGPIVDKDSILKGDISPLKMKKRGRKDEGDILAEGADDPRKNSKIRKLI